MLREAIRRLLNILRKEIFGGFQETSDAFLLKFVYAILSFISLLKFVGANLGYRTSEDFQEPSLAIFSEDT